MTQVRAARLRSVLPMLAALALPPAAYAAPVAITQNGPVTGKTVQGMHEFLGIRYAAPPVGGLRWMPPQPVPADMATTTATAFGPHCAQSTSYFGFASTSEDCLYLNVYTPAGTPPGTKLPVMVWVHGGALVEGESDDYDPIKLVNPGKVVVVTLNYRLGYLGFLAEAGLDAEGHVAGNYGLLDQQFALDWVRRNIAGFGGDSSQVTLAGESAGGLSVLSNMVSPTAYGLFNRAIVESGGYALNLPTLAQSEPTGAAVAQALGCAVADTACLRAASVPSILATQANAALNVTTIVDGTTLPLSINTALSTGKFARVPVLNGSNHDEGRLFVTAEAGLTAAEYPFALASLYGPALAPLVATEYPVRRFSQPVLALATALGDQLFSCTARQVDRWLLPHVPVFAYEFNDENAPEDSLPNVGYPYAATHATEIQFLWVTPEQPGTPPLTLFEEKLSRTMSLYWTNFVNRSSPNGQALPNWPNYSGVAEPFQSLVPPNPATEANFSAMHHCGFWEATVINPK